MKKTCTQCKKELPLDQFTSTQNIERVTCNKCRERGQRCRNKHLEERMENTKTWKQKNKEYVKLMNEFYRSTSTLPKEDRLVLKEEFKKKHGIENKVLGIPSEHRKNHYEHNGIVGKDCSVPQCGWKPLTEYNFRYNSWDQLRTTCKSCLTKKRSESKDVRRLYYERQDVHFKLRNNISHRIRESLQKSNIAKDLEVIHYLGCNIIDFKKHIESKFTMGMSWDKYGVFKDENGVKTIGFHIDHIIPCKAFDFSNPQEILLCFHWMNCQPMWGIENMKKSAKYEMKDKLDYIQKMEDVCKDVNYNDLLKNIERDLLNNTSPKQNIDKIQKEKQQQELYNNYIFDQALQDVQVMFFMYENPPDSDKIYTETPYFRMKNKQSRKVGEDNPRSKKVCKVSTKGILLNTYVSMSEAAKANFTYQSSISKCCSKTLQLFMSGGYYWCFQDKLSDLQHRIAQSMTTTESKNECPNA